MRKNKLTSSPTTHRQFDIDEWALMPIESMKLEYEDLRACRDFLAKRKLDLRPVEEDICYAQREFEIRMQRAEAHAHWLEQNTSTLQEWNDND